MLHTLLRRFGGGGERVGLGGARVLGARRRDERARRPRPRRRRRRVAKAAAAGRCRALESQAATAGQALGAVVVTDGHAAVRNLRACVAAARGACASAPSRRRRLTAPVKAAAARRTPWRAAGRAGIAAEYRCCSRRCCGRGARRALSTSCSRRTCSSPTSPPTCCTCSPARPRPRAARRRRAAAAGWPSRWPCRRR